MDTLFSKPKSRTNRHPADQLAEIRSTIRNLEEREAILRAELLADGANRRGDEWEAVIKVRKIERLDVPAARRALGTRLLQPFLRSSATEFVYLEPIE